MTVWKWGVTTGLPLLCRIGWHRFSPALVMTPRGGKTTCIRCGFVESR